MRNLIVLFVLAFVFCSSGEDAGISIGDEAPAFSLKNIDGNMVSLNDYKDENGVIVIFSCNHCPFVVAYEERMQALHETFEGKGYPVVAINPNDEKKYPSDSYDEMIKRAEERGFTFDYLRDESQATAKAYGAKKTPHVYLLKNVDGKFICKYIGAIDDNAKSAEEVTTKYVENAIASLEKNKTPDPSTTKAVGCSIKWK